ncbi:hypothetical protein, partial [Pseudomonas aeruginosa]|uniref:hypothetical protein n=1 Tax=Pseudomonas aeruginosa TaxID=287 RepID=UPI002F9519D5
TKAGRLAATTRNPLVLAGLAILLAPFAAAAFLVRGLGLAIRSASRRSRLHRLLAGQRGRFSALVRTTAAAPQDNRIALRLYRFM